MLTGKQGEASKVIKVAVGQDNEVEGVRIDQIVPGDGVVSGILGMNTGIDNKAEGPVSQSVQFAPIPPWGFRSVNFMNGSDQGEFLGDIEAEGAYADMNLVFELVKPVEGTRRFMERWVT